MKPFIVIAAMVAFLVPFVIWGQVEAPTLTPEEQQELVIRSWIERLADCESGNNEKAINKFDGGSRSVGVVQFKDGTYKSYTLRYGLPYNPQDIWIGEKQKELAYRMLSENINNQNHWYNCANKIGKL